MTIRIAEWHGCYDEGWKDLIVPAAFAHPAKMGRGLVARIFDVLLDSGALTRGDLVVDPFGGIGTTAIEGASRGVQVVCVELEQKFVDLAEQNVDLHRHVWRSMGRPLPFMLQGDSRQLRQRLGLLASGADALVASPPYAEMVTGAGGLNTQPAQHAGQDAGRSPDSPSQQADQHYGAAPGQLAMLPAGTVDEVAPALTNEQVAYLDARADAVLGSPPYATEQFNARNGIDPEKFQHARPTGWSSQARKTGDYGETDGQLAGLPEGAVDAVVASPPHTPDALGHTRSHHTHVMLSPAEAALKDPKRSNAPEYGDTPGQLGEMSTGTVDAIVSSPPFTPSAGGGGINQVGYRTDGVENDMVGSRTFQGSAADRAPGNLESLKLGDVDAVVSSPPYERSLHPGEDGIDWGKAKTGNDGGTQAPGASVRAAMPADAVVSSPPYEGSDQNYADGRKRIDWEKGARAGMKNDRISGPEASYGDAPGQLAAAAPETFWTAAAQIARECYAILKPGGTAVWVVKAFVRDKQLVDFPGDWRRLCEHIGFETTLEAHAMLVREEQRPDLFDGTRTVRKERKSFFRRLAEKKGSPKIDFEVVYFMRKPDAQSPR